MVEEKKIILKEGVKEREVTAAELEALKQNPRVKITEIEENTFKKLDKMEG